MRQGPCSEGPNFLEKTSINKVNKDELMALGGHKYYGKIGQE